MTARAPFLPILLAACCSALMLASCSNSGAPAPAARWMYYPLSKSLGAAPADAGLYCYNVYADSAGRIAFASVASITAVANNGVVLLEYEDSLRQRLWGRCENGQLIPVPFPQTQDSAISYSYVIPTGITLSREGHRALYRVLRDSTANPAPTDRRPQIVYFDCAKWEMTIVDPAGLIREAMVPLGATYGRVGDFFAFTDDAGTGFLFELRGMAIVNGTESEVARQIVEWKNGLFRAVTAPAPPGREGPVACVGYCAATGRLLRAASNGADLMLSSLDCATGTEIPLSLPMRRVWHRQQIAQDRDEMAAWGVNGIEIRRVSDGGLVSLALPYAELDSRFGAHAYHDYAPLCISPDAQWIAAGIIPAAKDTANNYDLFVFRRNGTDIRLVGQGLRTGVPAISGNL